MRLAGLLRSGAMSGLLALNFIFPFLVEITAPRATGDVTGLIAVNHYAQMTILALVWLLTPGRGPTALYAGLTAVSVLAVGLMGQQTVFSVTVGWVLCALVAADAASRLTRRVRDRRAAAQAASLVLDELQRDRVLASLKLLIGLVTLLDGLMVVIYGLRPGFAEGTGGFYLPTLAAAGLTAAPVLLMTAGGRRPELICLAAAAALAGLGADLWLMARLWGLNWADFIRLLQSLEFHLRLARLLGQAGAAAGLAIIAAARVRDLRRARAARPRFQQLAPLRPLRMFAGLALLSAALTALHLGAADYLWPEAERRPWAGSTVARGLGRLRLDTPADLKNHGEARFALNLEHAELKFTEYCGIEGARPFPADPGEAGRLLPLGGLHPLEADQNREPGQPQSPERLPRLTLNLTGRTGLPAPARLEVEAGLRGDGRADCRRLNLSLAVPFDGGRVEIVEDESLEEAAPGSDEFQGRTLDEFLAKAEDLLAGYRWAGGSGPEAARAALSDYFRWSTGADGDKLHFRTLCGYLGRREENLSGRVSFTDGRRSVLTVGYGEWYDDSVPLIGALWSEVGSLYVAGRFRGIYRLRSAAGRPGLEQFIQRPDPEAPGHTRLTLTWRPDRAADFPAILRLDVRVADRDPDETSQALGRWEAILDSLRPAGK